MSQHANPVVRADLTRLGEHLRKEPLERSSARPRGRPLKMPELGMIEPENRAT